MPAKTKVKPKTKPKRKGTAARSKKRLEKLVDTSNEGFLSNKKKVREFLNMGPGTRKRVYKSRAKKTSGATSTSYKRAAKGEAAAQKKMEKKKK